MKASWHARVGGIVAVLLSLTALSGQNGLTLSLTQITFKMTHRGKVPDGTNVQVECPAGVSWTAAVSRDPASDQPWLVLNGGNDPVKGNGPGAFQVGLRGWMASAKGPGNYTETVVVTPQGGRPINIKVNYSVAARLPDPKFRYLSGPVGCKQTRDFPDADTCTVPDDWPNPMEPPKKGFPYRDANFGSTIHVLTDYWCAHAYSTPSGVSAGNSYVLVWCTDGTHVINSTTGANVFTPTPSHDRSARWDARNDAVYYYMNNAAIMKVDVVARKMTTLIDYAKDGHKFTKIQSGGTGDTSKDNWNPFWAPNEHQVCVLDTDNVRTYCADYSKLPGLPVQSIDYTLVAKGIDRPTGKRYVLLMSLPSLAVFSVNQAAGRLDFEYRGPEDPEKNGNHNGTCDPGETCLGTPHSDTFEDSSGIQYLVYNSQAEPCEFALATYRINAGPKILIDAELGGGRRRVMAIDKCSGPGPWPKDDHVGCAKNAPYCAISTTYGVFKGPQDKTPIVRTPHESELFLMHDNGAEIIRLAQLRSLRFTTDGDEGYWTQSRACLSNDASIAIADTNFSQPGKTVRVLKVETGVAAKQ